jgi:hypothetical protein
MIKVHGMVWEDKEKYSTLSMVLIIFTSERNSILKLMEKNPVLNLLINEGPMSSPQEKHFN